MLKPKFKNIFILLGASLVFVLLPMFSLLPRQAQAVTCVPGTDKWCVGKCDISYEIDKTTGKVKVDPKTGKPVQNNPTVAADPKKVRSCQCDSTPFLTDAQLTSCEACKSGTSPERCVKENPIVKDINTIIKILSGIVAIVITGSIIFGGIQYSTSINQPDATAKAKKRIANSILALVLFILTFTLLEWLIPGGF